ncbi:MAG: carboxynorspermidine decarboxylase [Elusimicrobia bacterium CG1_02_37_114]|nr:MAG: carboxynorspermidine decarboxylase [Elusimicrobia bacterium CG1_02_37_114]PIZ13980.1 MAG: carboxynorspermidine decarboxylase [Elusimicrobia bacterium CG_4_10_14_0_8_um_filter_37_32]
MNLITPYYLIHESKLLKNLKILKHVRDISGAKSMLALKCFSTWCVFNLMKKYMDGTTGSSLYEARLGHEKFGKEVHAYNVAFSKEDIREIKRYADKIIFNSISQLKMFYKDVRTMNIGLRVNPQISYSHYDLADPARRYSRLGVINRKSLLKVLPLLKGMMFHFNCENDDFENFSSALDTIGHTYGNLFKQLEWVSLGGGLYFTKDGYPLEKFCRKLKGFADKFRVQVYLEPGETAITRSAELVTKVLDVVHNELDIAIVDASTEAHMLDLLIYRTPAKIESSGQGKYEYMIAGRSCLAGDIFGTYRFKSPLKAGSVIKISDSAGYTMVKKNWFNGLQMPSIVVKRLNGTLESVRQFNYKDFLYNLS